VTAVLFERRAWCRYLCFPWRSFRQLLAQLGNTAASHARHLRYLQESVSVSDLVSGSDLATLRTMRDNAPISRQWRKPRTGASTLTRYPGPVRRRLVIAGGALSSDGLGLQMCV
jgi:hypothetical protein